MGRVPEDALVSHGGMVRRPDWLTTKFALRMKALKIDCSLHALRHTHVSQLIAAGMDIVTISRRLGHANPTITLRVYGHLFNNTDERAATITEAAFSKV